MKHLICNAICASILAGTAAAAPLVSGTVTSPNGTPLADVQVEVESRTDQTVPQSDTQGYFQFDAAMLFAPGELRDAGALTLKFSKPGFNPAAKRVSIAEGSSPSPVKITLEPIGGSGAIPSTEKEALNKYVAGPGKTPLFLFPYKLRGFEAAELKVFNDNLLYNLDRVIKTYLQASGVSRSHAVSLMLLPIEQANNIDLHTYGTYLNALAMITGRGGMESAIDGSRSLEVTSTFQVVPQAETVGAPRLDVDDTVPPDRVASPRLSEHLKQSWGRYTVLAIGLSEYRQAVTDHDKESLKRIRQYLRSERKDAGRRDKVLVSELNILIGAVEKELAK